MRVKLKLKPEDPLDCLPGVGPRRKEEFGRLGFEKIRELLLHIPSQWEDRRAWTSLSGLPGKGSRVMVRGLVRDPRIRKRAWRPGIITAQLEQDQDRLELIWFNARQMPKGLEANQELGFYGVLRDGRSGELQLVNPEIIDLSETPSTTLSGIVPVYRDIGNIGGRTLRRIMMASMPVIDEIRDYLDDEARRRLELPGLAATLRFLHQPPSDVEIGELEDGLCPAHRRLFFDQALLHFLAIEKIRTRRAALKAHRIRCSQADRRELKSRLPFVLTTAQERVLDEIFRDLEKPRPMARLLQGDVGSGKTAVAVLAMAASAASGHQAALMAPTEILAEQHARNLRSFFKGTPWRVATLHGGQKTALGRMTRSAIRKAEAEIVVGTHSLIQESVEFGRLGLVVIDEQHRFGTLQRRDLVLKGETPHLLVMTATPIPRSLALSLFGDLDLSLLDQKPAGRRAIRTEIRTEAAREKIFSFLRKEIGEGGRVYCVFPLIESSEQFDGPALMEQIGILSEALPGVEIGILHGRMSSEEKDRVQARFRSGEIQFLMSTTVIEVGVDVPQATVMMIEGAHRFGLSQLHQLRGRVGRGERASWCIAMIPEEPSKRARRRLEIFASTDDGFLLAEEDLKMRGPGELTGTRQWGAALPFDPEKNWELVLKARKFAAELESTGRSEAVVMTLADYYGKRSDEEEWKGMTG